MALAYVLASLAWTVISVVVFLAGFFVEQKLLAKLSSSWLSDLSVAAAAGAAQFAGLMAVCFITGYFDVQLTVSAFVIYAVLWVAGYAGTGERWKDDTGETVTVVLGGLLGLALAAAHFHSPGYYYVAAGVGVVLGLCMVGTFCQSD